LTTYFFLIPKNAKGVFFIILEIIWGQECFMECRMKNEMMIGIVDKLVRHLESLRIAEYMELLQHPTRLILTNLVGGMARGLGIAIGATVVFAVVLSFLHQLILLNIPGIGGFIAEIMHIVELKNGKF
jgi:hypothetical protein